MLFLAYVLAKFVSAAALVSYYVGVVSQRKRENE